MSTLTGRPFWQSDVETLTRDQLQALQFARLKEQVNRSSAAAFYQRLWRIAGFRPDLLQRPADLGRLPILLKQDLLEAQGREPPLGDMAWNAAGSWQEVFPVNTAGGGVLYTAYSAGDLERNREVGARILWGCGVRPGDVIHNGLVYGLFAGGLAVHRSAKAVGAGTIPIGSDSVQRQVEFLFNFKPTVVLDLPSHALHLADQIRERGLSPLDVGLRIGLFGGEPGVAAGRSQLEQAFGIRAYDFYGITEVAPVMAAECVAQDGLHWAEDHFLVEIIDPDTQRPCRPGELGVLVITDLTGEHMPLLRYSTGDFAVLTDEPCRCGRTHVRTLGGIRGRADGMVIFRGRKFYPAKVEQVLAGHLRLSGEYRIVLEAQHRGWGDSCTVLVEAISAGGPALEEIRLLQQHLQDETHPDVTLQVLPYGTLERPGRERRVEDRR